MNILSKAGIILAAVLMLASLENRRRVTVITYLNPKQSCVP